MDDLEFREGATHDGAIGALRRAESDISNVRGGAGVGSSYLSNYLATCEGIELVLGNVFPVEVVDSLVRTSDYWALRSAPYRDETTRAVSRACDRDRARYHELGERLRLEGLRWRKPAAALMVPDTNMLIGDEPLFERVDWPTLTGSQIVRIALPIIVVHEMDRLKREGNQTSAKGARRALRCLDDVLPKMAGQRSTNLTPGPFTTTIEVCVDQGPRRRPDPDGDIIAFARRLAVVSELPTVLFTRDLGMRLRAGHAGVESRQLDDPPVLPEPDTAMVG